MARRSISTGSEKGWTFSLVSGREGVDFRPHPYARYEGFLEMLALTRRAAVEHVRVDNRAFADALDPVPPRTIDSARRREAVQDTSRPRRSARLTCEPRPLSLNEFEP